MNLLQKHRPATTIEADEAVASSDFLEREKNKNKREKKGGRRSG